MSSTFVYDVESVPIVVGLEPDCQFGEDDHEDPNLAAIANQLPATTFWAFSWEFFCKLPELILQGSGIGGYDSVWRSGVGKQK